MGTNYPASVDSFSVPTAPASTTLSSSGTSTRTHTQNHLDLGEAVEALETNAAQLTHDHSGGSGAFATEQLRQANTHQNPDTDSGVNAIHHTLGRSATQAAAGNHAHDYSEIINTPYRRCTSTTRPLDPVPGMMIWETDTNCVRAWANFGQGNILNQGISYTYGFNTNNSGSHLDTSLFSTSYVNGVSPSDGVTFSGSSPTIGSMGAAVSGQASWTIGTNVNARAIARAIMSTYATTVTDDQVVSFTTGTTTLVTTNDLGIEAHASGITSPANDVYLRMSSNEASYVRFTINGLQAEIWYTTNGPANETFLGAAIATTPAPHTTWTAKAIGNAYLFYAGNELLISVIDNANAINVGSNNRGWGLGMVAAYSPFGGQLVPNSLASITVADQPFYTSGGIWQLLPVGKVPHVRAESHFRQQVVVGNPGGIVGFDTVLYDWNPYPFFAVEVSQTDITIQESGHYSVNASINWDGSYNAFDHAMVGITVNGLDIGRKQWDFMRGNGFFPGFNQVQQCHFTYYFAAGDILRVQAQHNASTIQWLNYIGTSPNIQTNWVEIDFIGA
jgi:hypothetical protein